MSLSRRNPKRDTAEPAIVERLRQLGAWVQPLSGSNVPDLLVRFKGVNHLVEVKTGRAKLRPGQQAAALVWGWVTLRDPEEATSWLLGLAPHQVRMEAKRTQFNPLDWDQA